MAGKRKVSKQERMRRIYSEIYDAKEYRRKLLELHEDKHAKYRETLTRDILGHLISAVEKLYAELDDQSE